MRVMTGDAIALRSRMLYFCLLDLLGLVRVTRDAKSLRVRIGQYHLPILRGSVADFAGLVCERWMRELLQKLRFGGLVRIVALNAIRGCERLIAVRLLERGV